MNIEYGGTAPERLWFHDGVIAIHMAQAANAAGTSLLEHCLPEGSSPPFHVHHDEDETFCVLEGRFRFRAHDESREVGPGEIVHLPAGTPHSFRVLSPGGGRCITVTHGGFEAMVREVSSPALGGAMPEPGPPSPAMQARLAEACARHGITLLGPPLA